MAEVVVVSLVSLIGLYVAFRQTRINSDQLQLITKQVEINRDQIHLQEAQVEINKEQIRLQKRLEREQTSAVILKYAKLMRGGTSSEKLDAIYALSQTGDESIGVLAMGLTDANNNVADAASSAIQKIAAADLSDLIHGNDLSGYIKAREKFLSNPYSVQVPFDSAIAEMFRIISNKPMHQRGAPNDLRRSTDSEQTMAVERALRLIRFLPYQQLLVSPSGYGPDSRSFFLLPVESHWRSPVELARVVIDQLQNAGYFTVDARFDRVRTEAVRLIIQFRQAQALTAEDKELLDGNEASLLIATADLLTNCDLRTANTGLYTPVGLYGQYPLPSNIDSFTLLGERVLDFISVSGHTSETRSVAIAAVHALKMRSVALNSGVRWEKMWLVTNSAHQELYINLCGPMNDLWFGREFMKQSDLQHFRDEMTKCAVQ
jgi:hypothetical protein